MLPLHSTLSPSEARQALQTMLSSYRITQMIAVVAQLGIADVLHDGPKSVDELAQATSTHAPSLYRLLRALASLGIFAEDAQCRFGLTALAAPLQSAIPESMRAIATFAGAHWRWHAWGNLLHSVRTGETAFDHTYGMAWFDYLAQHPAASAVFAVALAAAPRHHAVMAAYNFARFDTLVDVGGGNGTLLATLLQAHPRLHGVLCEAAHVAAHAQGLLEAAGVIGRCEIVECDFFVGIPGGGDAYLLSLIIHDWHDDQAVTILQNCHRAMPAHGTLLLVEQVVPSDNTPSPSKLRDITMLVETGGRERTAAEFRSLFAAAGFQLTAIVPTRAPECVIEGVRV
jgi:hypothetical protein